MSLLSKDFNVLIYSSMKTKTNTTMGALAALLVTSTSYAGAPAPAVSTPEAGLGVTGTAGLSIASGYVFRGQVLSDKVTYSPTLNLSLPVDLSVLGVDSAAVQLQTTQVVTQNAPTAGWFRSETSLGVQLTKGVFVVTPSYQVFNSPNNKFDTAQGVGVKVGVKECCALGLRPYGQAFFGAGGNANNGSSSGSFYEFGVAPSFKVGSTTVSTPAAIGVGAGNYYVGNNTYGYTTVGVRTSTPLTKDLNLTAGVDYWNTPNALGNSQKNNVITSVGVTFSF